MSAGSSAVETAAVWADWKADETAVLTDGWTAAAMAGTRAERRVD